MSGQSFEVGVQVGLGVAPVERGRGGVVPGFEGEQSLFEHVEVGEGNGPVNALDHALRKALVAAYPDLAHVHLTDYKVRILDDNADTDAVVRVLIESTDGDEVWTTIGVSTNIIEASWMALIDALVYGLLRTQK
mgnify:CR=1 FL=1